MTDYTIPMVMTVFSLLLTIPFAARAEHASPPRPKLLPAAKGSFPLALEEKVRRLLAELDDEEPAPRERALTSLGELLRTEHAPQIVQRLQEARAAATPEAKRGLERLLARVAPGRIHSALLDAMERHPEIKALRRAGDTLAAAVRNAARGPAGTVSTKGAAKRAEAALQALGYTILATSERKDAGSPAKSRWELTLRRGGEHFKLDGVGAGFPVQVTAVTRLDILPVTYNDGGVPSRERDGFEPRAFVLGAESLAAEWLAARGRTRVPVGWARYELDRAAMTVFTPQLPTELGEALRADLSPASYDYYDGRLHRVTFPLRSR